MISSQSILDAQSLKLNAGDCSMLAGFLPERLEPSTDNRVDAAWCVEIERRMHALDNGAVESGKPVVYGS